MSFVFLSKVYANNDYFIVIIQFDPNKSYCDFLCSQSLLNWMKHLQLCLMMSFCLSICYGGPQILQRSRSYELIQLLLTLMV